MADLWTKQVGNSYCPQMHLSYWIKSENQTSATIEWYVDFVAHGYAAYTDGAGRVYEVWIDDGPAHNSTYNINGQAGTVRLASSTKTVPKTYSGRNVPIGIGWGFNVTWNGVYGEWLGADGSIYIGPKTSYTVAYDANGGSGGPGNQTKWHDEKLTISSTKPTRTGYSFQGWATSASGGVAYQPGGSYTSNAEVTLYAVWKADTYSVKYDANGGTGAPAAQTKTHDVTLKLSTTKPTRTNYNFLGWGTSASSTTVAYAAGANYTTNAPITLYAIWEIAYTPPRITNVEVDRCNSSGTFADDGTYVKVIFDWAVDSVYSSGVTSIKIGQKKSGSSSYTYTTVSASGKSGKVNKVIGSSSLEDANYIDTEYQYDIRIEVVDNKGSSYIESTIAPTVYIIDFLSGGDGIAFGKPAANEGFECAFPATFENTFKSEGAATFGGKITTPFLTTDSSNNPTITKTLGLSNNIWLRALLSSGSYQNILRMNSSNQVELDWTSGGLKGRVFKTLWEGSCSVGGTMSVPELPYYRMLLVDVDDPTVMNPVICVPRDFAMSSGVNRTYFGSMADDFNTSRDPWMFIVRLESYNGAFTTLKNASTFIFNFKTGNCFNHSILKIVGII